MSTRVRPVEDRARTRHSDQRGPRSPDLVMGGASSLVFDGTALGIAVVDPDGRIVSCNLPLRRMLGYREGELAGTQLCDLSHPDDWDSELNLHRLLLESENGRYSGEKRYLRQDGLPIRCHVTAAFAPAPEDGDRQAVVTFEDITEHSWTTEALEEKERQLRAVVDQTRDGIFIGTPQGLVVMYNRAMESISGYSMIEANLEGWFNLAIPDPSHRATVVQMAARALCGECGSVEVPIVRKDGRSVWVAISMSPITVGGQQFALGMVTDVTQMKQQEEHLSYLATHDTLTGLFNRRVLEVEIGRELSLSKVRGPRAVLLYADLDGFKSVNDAAGHAAGDQVLVALSQLLINSLRAEDIPVRVGGDEFAVLLFETNLDAARAVAERLRRSVDQFPFRIEGRTFHLGLSIGVAVVHGQSDVGEVLSYADRAMYAAKSLGRNRVEVYSALESKAALNPGCGDSPANAGQGSDLTGLLR